MKMDQIPLWLCRGHCNSWNPRKERCNVRGASHCDHPWAEWAVEKEKEKERKRQDKGAP